MWAPSNAMPLGDDPTANVPSRLPSLACSLLTLLSLEFDTQIWAPSKTTPPGPFPTVNVAVWFAGYQRRMAMALVFCGGEAEPATSGCCADKHKQQTWTTMPIPAQL